MRIVRGAIPAAVTVALLTMTTAALWYARQVGLGPHHPVFMYLLPIVFIAMAYGGRIAGACAIAAIMCASFFLYDPIYSFAIANRREYGDLICFAVLALLAVKCAVELLRPAKCSEAAKPPYRRRYQNSLAS